MLIELMLKSIMIVNKNIFSRELWKWVLISSVEISPFIAFNYNLSDILARAQLVKTRHLNIPS